MNEVRFSEILAAKLKQNSSDFSCSEIPSHPYPERISELHPDLFFLSVEAPRRTSLKGYPKPQTPSRKTAAPQEKKIITPREKTPKKVELQVRKDLLDEVSLSKWHRFESMVGQNFGATLGKSQVLSAFRTFIKTVHPDLAQEKTGGAKVNVATLVKVKDELLEVLKAQDGPKAGSRAGFTEACGT